MFPDFYDHHFDLDRLNRAIICLIPKKQDASYIKYFRPISLLNYSYKIFSKVLTNRLYPILDRLIRNNQNAFFEGSVYFGWGSYSS
jgi:Reverse transcriptase (RNA-dependent DNA polymerase)